MKIGAMHVGRLAVNVHKYLEEKTGKKCPQWYFVARTVRKILDDETINASMIDAIKNDVVGGKSFKYRIEIGLPDDYLLKPEDDFYNLFRKEFLDTVGVKEFAEKHFFDTDESIITKEDEEIITKLCANRFCDNSEAYIPLRCFVNAFKWTSNDFSNINGIYDAMQFMVKLHFIEGFNKVTETACKFIGRIIKMQPDVCDEIKDYDFTKLIQLYDETTQKLEIEGMEDL